MVLEKLNVWKFNPSHCKMCEEHQKAPLRMIFDVKKQCLRSKSRCVVGSHKIGS